MVQCNIVCLGDDVLREMNCEYNGYKIMAGLATLTHYSPADGSSVLQQGVDSHQVNQDVNATHEVKFLFEIDSGNKFKREVLAVSEGKVIPKGDLGQDIIGRLSDSTSICCCDGTGGGGNESRELATMATTKFLDIAKKYQTLDFSSVGEATGGLRLLISKMESEIHEHFKNKKYTPSDQNRPGSTLAGWILVRIQGELHHVLVNKGDSFVAVARQNSDLYGNQMEIHTPKEIESNIYDFNGRNLLDPNEAIGSIPLSNGNATDSKILIIPAKIGDRVLALSDAIPKVLADQRNESNQRIYSTPTNIEHEIGRRLYSGELSPAVIQIADRLKQIMGHNNLDDLCIVATEIKYINPDPLKSSINKLIKHNNQNISVDGYPDNTIEQINLIQNQTHPIYNYFRKCGTFTYQEIVQNLLLTKQNGILFEAARYVYINLLNQGIPHTDQVEEIGTFILKENLGYLFNDKDASRSLFELLNNISISEEEANKIKNYFDSISFFGPNNKRLRLERLQHSNQRGDVNSELLLSMREMAVDKFIDSYKEFPSEFIFEMLIRLHPEKYGYGDTKGLEKLKSEIQQIKNAPDSNDK